GLGTERQCVGEVQAIEAALATQPFGHAPKDLRGDHARVAAGPHQRSKTDGPGNAICGLIRDLFALFQRRAGGGEHVRAGIVAGGGAPPGWKRRPSTWMERWAKSRPVARRTA